MKYSVTIRDEDWRELTANLSQPIEKGAFLICGISKTADETRFLVQKIIYPNPEDILLATNVELSIDRHAYQPLYRHCAISRTFLGFVHSHPQGPSDYSTRDDQEEKIFFNQLWVRAPKNNLGLSLLITPDGPKGRVFTPEGISTLSLIRLVGHSISFIGLEPDNAAIEPDLAPFDRQTKWFGKAVQKQLKRLHVGVVGCGSTGSSVIQQLTRLGVGKLTLIEPQTLEDTNVTRVYGSGKKDIGEKKVIIQHREITEIGFETKVVVFPENVASLRAAQSLRDCDVIFCCTDDSYGRSIVNKLAAYYLIPTFDVGAQIIDDGTGLIDKIHGRVTMLFPGAACLLCRERLIQEQIDADALRLTNPTEAAKLEREGYLPAAAGNEASVISITSTVASWAILEFLHKLVGFMGSDRKTTEVIFRFEDTALSRNVKPSKAQCYCVAKSGVGDRVPFLDRTWPILT